MCVQRTLIFSLLPIIAPFKSVTVMGTHFTLADTHFFTIGLLWQQCFGESEMASITY